MIHIFLAHLRRLMAIVAKEIGSLLTHIAPQETHSISSSNGAAQNQQQKSISHRPDQTLAPVSVCLSGLQLCAAAAATGFIIVHHHHFRFRRGASGSLEDGSWCMLPHSVLASTTII
jgi:hypothetical protein